MKAQHYAVQRLFALLLLLPLAAYSQTRIKDIAASTNFVAGTKLLVDDATFGVRTMTIDNVRGLSTNTLFLSDGILSGNRLVDLDGRTLAFEDGGAFEVDATNVFLDGLDALTIRSTNELNVIAEGSFHLYTPRYFDTSSSSNAVLTLVDPLTGKAEFVTLEELQATTQTADRVLVLDGNKKLRSAAPSASEIDFVAGVTSAIQTQINVENDRSTAVAGTVSLAYDSGGRITVATRPLTTTTNYYLASGVIASNSSAGLVRVYSYDSQGRISTITVTNP
jgi:hypothetical protein